MIEPLEGRTLLATIPNFAPFQAVGTGYGVLAAADLNGDGLSDLLVNVPNLSKVGVLLNKGDGTFEPKPDVVPDKPLMSWTAADLTGDGKVDLAFTNWNDRSVSVLPGNGDGTFGSSINSPMGLLGSAIAPGDFNGDGKTDLVVAGDLVGDRSENVGVLLNNGDGTFSPATPQPALGASFLAAADFNGDGLADVAVTRDGYGDVNVLLSNGNGTLQPGIGYVTGAAGTNASQLTTADFNSDGRPDLAVGTYIRGLEYAYGAKVLVLLNNGNGAFAAPTEYKPTSRTFSSLFVGDFNADGRADLAVTANGTVSVMASNSDGTFAPFVDYVIHTDDPFPTYAAAADFNLDGRLDLAVQSRTEVGLMLNMPDRPPTDISLAQATVPDRQPAGRFVGTLAATDPDPTTAFTYSLVGRPEGYDNAFFSIEGNVLKTAAPLDAGQYSIRVRSTDPGGLFIEKVLAINIIPGIFNTRADYPGSRTDIVDSQSRFSEPLVADLNDDGKPDIVVPYLPSGAASGQTLGVLLNNGDGTFASEVNYVAGFGPRAAQVADLNGDGKPDLVVAIEDGEVCVLLNNGDGTFAPTVEYAIGFNPRDLAVADFNGDGRPDLALAGRDYSSGLTQGFVSVLLNDGTGALVAFATYGVNSWPSSLEATDINGDGRTDLVVGPLSVLLSNGDGSFAPAVNYPATGGHLAIADFNGDGTSDVAVVGDNVVSVLLNNGDGTLGPKTDYGAGGRFVTAADFNGDGRPDLAMSYGRLSVLLNNGDGTFAPRVDYAADLSHLGLAAADFNGDGRIDLAATGYSSQSRGVVSVLLNNGDGTFGQNVDYTVSAGPGSPVYVVSADFNGDGRVDLAVSTSESQTTSVLLNLPPATTLRTPPTPPTPTPVPPPPASSAPIAGPSAQPIQAVLVSGKPHMLLRSDGSTIIDFGKLKAGQSGPVHMLRLTNTGKQILTLGAAKATKGFKVVQALPKTLAPGKSAVLKVQFVGQSTGTWSGRIRFATDDHNPFVIAVSARRMRSARRLDVHRA